MCRWHTAWLLTGLLTLAGLAHARPPEQPTAAAREFVLEGKGGAFEVTVSPAYVTVFYLPEPVTKALASDQRNFSITVMGDTVAIRPTKDLDLTANLNIDTRSFHISVILSVGPAAQAVSQVIFTPAEDKVAFEERVNREVDRRVAPLRAEVDRKQRSLEALVQSRADREIAERLLHRYAARTLRGIARTDDNVVVTVDRAVWIGGDLHVFFAVQNRGDAPYRVRSAAVMQGPKTIPCRPAFQPRATGATAGPDAPIGVVEGGQRGAGVLVLPAGKVLAGQPIEVRLLDARTGEWLSIGGLRLE